MTNEFVFVSEKRLGWWGNDIVLQLLSKKVYSQFNATVNEHGNESDSNMKLQSVVL